MNRIYENLSAPQERFLQALMASETVADAARLAKVPDSTARRWLRDPQVRAAWLDLRRQAFDLALTGIQAATRQAVQTLRDCLQPKMPPGVRVRAAQALIDLNAQSIERDSLEARVAELEAALATYQDHQDRAPLTALEVQARRYA